MAMRAAALAVFLLLAVGAGVGLSARDAAPQPPISSAPKPPASPLPAAPVTTPPPRGKRPVVRAGKQLAPKKELPPAASIDGITNAGFETGDLTGWTAGGLPADQTPYVTQSYQGFGSQNLPPPTNFLPPSGQYFAVVPAGCQGDDVGGTQSLTSQSFTANAGDTVSGWAFFQANDYLPYNDSGGVQIVTGEGAFVATLYSANVTQLGDFGGPTNWFHWTYTFTSDGTYAVQAYATNDQDCAFTSVTGIDMPEGDVAPAPPVPILESPADGSTVSSSPTLTWDPSDGAQSYDVGRIPGQRRRRTHGRAVGR